MGKQRYQRCGEDYFPFFGIAGDHIDPGEIASKISLRHETLAYLMTKLAPSFTPLGQRQLTVLVLV